MTYALRQTVTVQEGGLIEFRSPQLTPGATAEVIVLLESVPLEAALAEEMAAWDALSDQALANFESSLYSDPN